MNQDDDAACRPWQVERSRILIEDRWIRVRADDCRTAEGADIAPYYVLDYPDWVVVVAIDAAGRLVLVEQYRHGLGIRSLELPTGAIEPGEAPEAAAARELAEETGYVASAWRYVGWIAPNPSNHSNRCHILLAEGARQDRAPLDDPRERMRILPTPVAEAARRALDGGIVQAMHVSGLLRALASAGRWPG